MAELDFLQLSGGYLNAVGPRLNLSRGDCPKGQNQRFVGGLQWLGDC